MSGYENGFNEEGMIITERYGQAVHTEMGFLQARVALSLLKTNPEKSKKFAVETLKFLDEYERLNLTAATREEEPLKRLKNIMQLIQDGKYTMIKIDTGLEIIAELVEPNKKELEDARRDYRRIFRPCYG